MILKNIIDSVKDKFEYNSFIYKYLKLYIIIIIGININRIFPIIIHQIICI